MTENTPNDTPRMPLEYLYQWERECPDSIFLTQPAAGGVVRDITWGEAASEIRRMANWLTQQGWPAGSRVAILGKNSAHWVLADLAIMLAGYVSVPSYSTFDAEALRYILEHSEARACFVGKLDDAGALQDGVPSGMPLIALPLAPVIEALSWDQLIVDTPPLTECPVTAAEQLWTIVYTSGTTGRPKGVMHNFGALRWAVGSYLSRTGASKDDRCLSYLPLAHIMERVGIEYTTVRLGGHLYFAESLDTFLADLRRAKPTLFISVPRLWVKFQQGVHSKLAPRKLSLLLKLPIIGKLVRHKVLAGLGLEHCRIAGSGSAPLAADVLRWYRSLGLELLEGYGMTENAITHGTLPGISKPGTVGVAYDGVDTRIDPETGEIQIRSPSTTIGYYKEPEQTAAAFTEDGWFRTGDKGQIEADGYLRITGRVKDIFKTSKGKYVVPAPIEQLLVNHPAVEACMVAGANFDQPFAILMLGADVEPSQRESLQQSFNELLNNVNQKLDGHEKLSFLALTKQQWTPESGLVTPTLKIKRAQLEAHYGADYSAWQAQKQQVLWVED